MILNQNYRTLKSKIISSGKLSIILAILIHFIFTLSINWTIITFLFAFIINLIFAGPKGTVMLYDGWIITKNSITISKHSILGFKEIKINISEIMKIIYSESTYKKPSYLIIHYNNQKALLYINYSIFIFVDTLKFFKRLGIDVSLSTRDVEIEMYLNDEIDKIPITNE